MINFKIVFKQNKLRAFTCRCFVGQ